MNQQNRWPRGWNRRPRNPKPLRERLKDWFYIASLWLLLGVAWFVIFGTWNWYWHDWAPAGAPMSEKVEDDEEYYRSEIIASTIRAAVYHRDDLLNGRVQEGTSDASAPGYDRSDYRRDVHTKSHGCVLAKFKVDDELPRQFRYGVFSAPGTSKAIIRFSSGQPDIEPDKTAWSWLPLQGDVRGMAVKVLDVDGKKLLDDHDHGPDDKTQDFIATTSPVFFIRTIEQYGQFSAAFSRVDLGEIRRYKAYFMPHLWYPPGWHLHQAALLAKSLKGLPDSLVRETYYSGSAFRLGPTDYVKFRMRPCDANIKKQPLGKDQKGAEFDYLRLELARQAEAGKACFNFEVQPQVIGKNMPVEDATVEWNEKDSPFQKVATITIDRQSSNTREINQRCENLEFNPWHSVEDFEPVGVMNRLRKVVYQQMADFRRKKNCEARCGSQCPGSYKACIDQCPWLKDPVPEKLFPDGCPAQPSASKPGN